MITVIDGLQEISDACTKLNKNIFEKAHEAPGFDPKQLEQAKERLNRMAAAPRLLAKRSVELHISLYDNGDALRIVPALNVAALDKNRDTSDDSQPWLTLQTVLYGSPQLLKAYPMPQIMAVRSTFARLVSAYTNQKGSDRSRAVTQAEDDFAAAVRTLGEKTSSLRKDLAIQNPDEDLMHYTAYPPAGATDVEVQYHKADPFKWSWIISLTAFFAFCLAFGNVKKPLFWVGTIVLLLGLGWSVYGFTLRVLVTRWAPVTNMYETVVYVPFFVSLLGTWFLLLPITWPGLRRAWSLTAIPGTWETSSESKNDDNASSFGLVNIFAIVARVGLMAYTFAVLAVTPYAAGGRTIISLMPVVDKGASMPESQ